MLSCQKGNKISVLPNQFKNLSHLKCRCWIAFFFMGSHHRAIFVRAFALLSKSPFRAYALLSKSPFRAYALLSKSPFRASKSPFQLDMLFWDEVDTFCTMVSLCMSLYQYITLTLQKSLHLSLPTTQQLTPTTPKPF